MKITATGGHGFHIKTKPGELGLSTGGALFATSHDGTAHPTEGRALTMPGEYELSQILIKGVKIGTTTAFKLTVEDMTIVHFGDLKAMPKAAELEEIGENITAVFVAVSPSFDAKKVDELIDKITPPIAIVGGEASLFASVVTECGAKLQGDSAFELKRSAIMPDGAQVLILA